MEYRYKLEIELDEDKIISDGKYEIDSIYDTIRSWFKKTEIPEVKNDDHMMTFISDRYDKDDYAEFGLIETDLMDADWFKPYVKKMLWYNRENGKNHSENIISEDERFRKKYGK